MAARCRSRILRGHTAQQCALQLLSDVGRVLSDARKQHCIPASGWQIRTGQRENSAKKEKKQGLLPRLSACRRDGLHRPRPSQHLACVASLTPKKAHFIILYTFTLSRACGCAACVLLLGFLFCLFSLGSARSAYRRPAERLATACHTRLT